MKFPRAIWIAIAALAVWLIVTWLLGGWIGITAPRLYYLRGGLWIIGLVGFAGFLILRPKDGGAAAGPAPISVGEIDDNFNEAVRRIQVTGIKQLAKLPTVFFLGDSGTAKTTTIVKSDIAQLLSGQAQQDAAILPTRAVNFWFAKNTIFVDAAGGLLGDEANRKRLFKKFSAVALKSVVGSNALPPRSVVLTVDCGSLMQAGGADAIAAKARQFQGIFAELAQELGASFPVYVLFTKADRITYFRDFVQNMNEAEMAEPFGVTLPLEAQHGVFAEHQTRRVTAAFQQLSFSLSDRRPAYLAIEHTPGALPNIYEFPREFNKLKKLLVDFLVDLCRPSQIGISPFLRGFYFTGTRTVSVTDVAPAAVQVAHTEDSGMSDASATRMFDFRSERLAPMADVRETAAARKVSQWVFLPHLLPSVVLADATAGQIGGANVKVNLARRIALGAAILAALFMTVWWSVSYSNNRALVHGALDAAKGVPVINFSGGQLPPLDALQRLTAVKEALAKLNEFKESGAPFKYGGFLYAGEDARDSVAKIYYGLFRRLLLAPTQERLVQVCTAPDQAKGYAFSYDALKSYLISTERHDKSVPEFLTPAMLVHWKREQQPDPRQVELARQNFDFYARELLNSDNAFLLRTPPDGAAVANCRSYLNQFGQVGWVYNKMSQDAGAGMKTFIFNDEYANSDKTVINRYPVKPQFTAQGDAAFENILKNPKKYFDGEPWVLGDKANASLNPTALADGVRKAYQADYIKAWKEYLAATSVRPYANLEDAKEKLDKLSSGSQSPLLLALCVAGENTAAPAEVRDVFQPVQIVTPAGCKQNGFREAQTYTERLTDLLASLKDLNEKDRATYDKAKTAASQAEITVKNIAGRFMGSSEAASPVVLVQKLLKAPIYRVEPPTISITEAKGACQEMAGTLNKYPFNPKSTVDATLDDVNGILKKPDGILWKLAASPALQPYVKQFGSSFLAANDGAAQVRPEFLAYLNNAARLAKALYKSDTAQNPSLAYSVQAEQLPGLEHLTLVMNGQQLSADLTNGAKPKEFTWPGEGQGGATLKIRYAGGGTEFTLSEAAGLWAPWRLMEKGEPVRGSGQEIEWIARSGSGPGSEIHTTSGAIEKARLMIDAQSLQALRPQFFKLTCIGNVLKGN